MLKHFVFVAAAAVLLLPAGYANESKGKITIPVEKVSPIARPAMERMDAGMGRWPVS
jgi:hypothetical protein